MRPLLLEIRLRLPDLSRSHDGKEDDADDHEEDEDADDATGFSWMTIWMGSSTTMQIITGI